MPFRSNKPARLEKPRTNNDQSSSKFARHDDADDTGLKSPNRYSIQTLSHQQLVTRQRQLLLRQFSDSSATGQDRCVRNISSNPDQYGEFKGSTSTVNTIVNDIEARTRIDVEQAIGLLQELKKTASPDELVALHRALLPVKEDTTVSAPQRPAIEERAYTSVPPERKRSVIPPGLATRSGILDDILRKPSDSLAETPAKPQRASWMVNTPKDKTRNDSPSRLSTRSEQAYCHAGAFASGTLRITNGAASPEPSIISKLAVESTEVEEEPKEEPPANTVDSRPSLPSLRERRSEDSAMSRPFRSSVTRQEDRDQLPSAGPRAGSLDFHSTERSKIRSELRLDPPLLQRHSFQHIPDPASTDSPRFQQRWGHRAAFLSQEYALDCDITESPYEEKTGFAEFAKRLSTVHDDGESEVGENCEVESRADALSRLTGVFEEGDPGTRTDIGTARTSDETETAIVVHNKILRKVDSGYCSDGSTSPLQGKSSAEAGKPRHVSAIQEQPNSPYEGSYIPATERHRPSDACESTNDTSSLLTFDDMVTSSPTTEAGNTSSTSQAAKKSPLSLFKAKTKASRKGSFNVLNVYHGERPKTSDGLEHVLTAQPSPPPSRNGPTDKNSKKLQKPMPESVRRQRKKTMESLKASTPEHSPTVRSPLTDDPAKQQDSDYFVGCQPRESTEAGEQVGPKSLRLRSKSFVGRRRSKTTGESQDDSGQFATQPLPSRKRSKSQADRTPPIPVSAGLDISPSMNCLKSAGPDMPARDRPVPVHTDFASVARALQSHPPDVSQNRTAPKPRRSSMQRYYTMHRIVTDPESVNALQAQSSHQKPEPDDNRINHVDEAQQAQTVEEQPPPPPVHRTPVNISSAVSARPVAVGSSYSVEDRFPDWQGKPTSPDATPPQTPTERPSSSKSWLALRHNRSESVIAAGIPPLPELPADIAAKVSRADQMVAKKMRLSPRSSPTVSARNSIDNMDARKQLLTKKTETRREQHEGRPKDARQAALDQLNVPREEEEDVSRGFSQASARWSVDGSIQLPWPKEQPLRASPTHDSRHPGWPGWEQQSSLWRQREALAPSFDTNEKVQIGAACEQRCESPSTPGIVVSRYITPFGIENAHKTNRASQDENDSAKKFAQEYASLIEDEEKENTPSRPAIPRADSVVSTATCVTTQSSVYSRPTQADSSRPNSALSSYTTTTTMSSTTSRSNGASSRSPFNRERQQYMRTTSGRFLPYRPSDASQAERSRALSIARAAASSENLAPPPLRPELKKSSSESLFDRYGGGMQYGWDRNSGSFGGSAGTRSNIDTSSTENRKSVKMSEDFGLDLSDIPVYLRKG